MIGGDRWVVE